MIAALPSLSHSDYDSPPSPPATALNTNPSLIGCFFIHGTLDSSFTQLSSSTHRRTRTKAQIIPNTKWNSILAYNTHRTQNATLLLPPPNSFPPPPNFLAWLFSPYEQYIFHHCIAGCYFLLFVFFPFLAITFHIVNSTGDFSSTMGSPYLFVYKNISININNVLEYYTISFSLIISKRKVSNRVLKINLLRTYTQTQILPLKT